MTPLDPQFQPWLDMAQRDYDVAMHLYGTFRPLPLETICFQCQQSAEKALKALYVLLRIPGGVPRTHDLTLLLDQMHRSVSIPPSVYDDADELSPYATAARYPSEAYFDEAGTNKALKAADAILSWVRERAASIG